MNESTRIRGDVIFDTNAASGLIRQLPDLMQVVDSSCRVHLPLAVVGELLYGANCAPNPERQLARVRSFAARSTVLFPDQLTAEVYGRIKTALRLKGRMIPENDLWIAATAIQHGLPVLTQDSHFKEVPGITHLTW